MHNTKCPHCGYDENPMGSFINCVNCGKAMITGEQLKQKPYDKLEMLYKSGNYDEVVTSIQNEGDKAACRLLLRILKFDLVQAVNLLYLIKEVEGIEIVQKPQHGEGTSGNTISSAQASLTTCPVCNGKLSTRATTCPHCGNPTGVHVCPKCGSTNTKTISGASKAASIYLWGPFAANKVVSKFQCKDCWHKW